MHTSDRDYGDALATLQRVLAADMELDADAKAEIARADAILREHAKLSAPSRQEAMGALESVLSEIENSDFAQAESRLDSALAAAREIGLVAANRLDELETLECDVCRAVDLVEGATAGFRRVIGDLKAAGEARVKRGYCRLADADGVLETAIRDHKGKEGFEDGNAESDDA